MSAHNRAGRGSALESSSQELREKGLTVVHHVFQPEIGQLVVRDTANLSLFARSRPLDATVGRVATLHKGVDLRHTVSGIAIHKVLTTGSGLGLRLGSQDTQHHEPNIQALELAAQYVFGSGRHGQDALGLAVLEGEIGISLNDGQQQLLEPGSAAFIQQTSESPQSVIADPRGHATALLFAGSAVVPAVTLPIH